MDVIQALKTRHSTRAYKQTPVGRETILKILDAANCAPSWANTQPWEVFVAGGEPLDRIRRRCTEKYWDNVPPRPDISIPQKWPEAHQKRTREMGTAHLRLLNIDRDDKEARAKMTARNLNFYGAPAVIFLCMEKTLTRWSMFDLGSFAQSVMLAAQREGLNTIPAIMMVVYPDIIREELKIPEDLAIVIGIALGYGDPRDIQNKPFTSRKPLEEFVRMIGL